jgi:hypothetical protein
MTSRPPVPVSRILLVVVSLVGLSVFAGAWGYFIVTFGWIIGGTLGLWPATLMGAGSALLLALGVTARRRSQPARAQAEPSAVPEAREI